MLEKPNKLEYTRDYDYNMWLENRDGKTTLHSDASLAYAFVLLNAYYNIDICVYSQDRKEYDIDAIDYVDGTLVDYLRKSNKIIAIKNDVIKIMV